LRLFDAFGLAGSVIDFTNAGLRQLGSFFAPGKSVSWYNDGYLVTNGRVDGDLASGLTTTKR
jgi:hypothetical protein